MTTKLTENKAEKESLTMRKQSYVIIGIGLAALAGIFWLAQFDGKEETTTATKPPSSSQETTVDSEMEKPIDPFAGMRRQSPSAVEPLSEEDKTLMAELDAHDKKEETFHNSPRGNYLETTQDFYEIVLGRCGGWVVYREFVFCGRARLLRMRSNWAG